MRPQTRAPVCTSRRASVLAERDLLLWRHGLAEERHPDRPDGERALTPEGIRRTAAVAEQLHQLQLDCDQLLSSPLRRAVQTAQLGVAKGLASGFGLDARLAPGGDPRPLLQAGSWRRLGLVGHEPDLGQLASSLLGAPAGTITLRKAGIVLIRLGAAGARLEALIGPRLLRLRQPSHRSP
ncbi:MAG: phosphohistidine phosphatase SixA [Cyanobacteria bacterium M_DeepCast_100m_m1_067]|nr:phosphohistidine phosphatase SixA [Cyanobacteria bacterium M_DeepCast_100m_m1_067]